MPKSARKRSARVVKDDEETVAEAEPATSTLGNDREEPQQIGDIVKVEPKAEEERLPQIPHIDVDALLPSATDPTETGMDLRVCPNNECEMENAVCWDDVDGLFVCHNCGWLVEPVGDGEAVVIPADEDVNGLVNETTFDAKGHAYGTVYVRADDSGARVAMNTMASPAGRRSVQRNQGYDGTAKVKKFVEEYGNLLNVAVPVVNEAKQYGSHIYDTIESRTMKLELMALSGLYLAIRMNGLPKTLVDLVAVVPRGNMNVYTIGRAYRRSLHELQQTPPRGPGLRLEIPRTQAKALVPKVFGILLAKYRCDDVGRPDTVRRSSLVDAHGEVEHATLNAVHRDARELVDFIERTEPRAQHPLVLAATAVYLAIQMNGMPKPTLDFVTRALGISEKSLKTKANFVKNTMAELGKVLSYGDNITPRNAMKYARVILRLSKLKRRSEQTDVAVSAMEATAGATMLSRHKVIGRKNKPMETATPGETILNLMDECGDNTLDDEGASGDEDGDDMLDDIDVDEYLRTQREVEDLVKMRNDLVQDEDGRM